MPDHPARRLSGLLSMDSQRRLPRPWVCGSLELTACARRSSSSTWFSRREGPSAHFAPTFPMGHAFCLARLVVCFFFSLSSLRPDVRSKEHASLFCLLASISLRITWVVAQHLLAQGKPIRMMSRNPLNLAHLQQQGVEVVRGDLRDPASLLNACQGVDQVLAAAHALVGKGDNNPQTVDDAGNRHLIDAAKAADVKHFIFVSVQGASPDSPLEFFRIKYRTEEYLRASGLNFTILRPSAFMDLWAQLIGQPIVEQGKTTIFGRGNNPINFVAVEDVARFVCTALEDPRARNRVIEVGGPENLTMNQVAEIFERVSGHQAKKRHIP